MDIPTDEHGAPILIRVSEHLRTLERMRDFRLQGLADVSSPERRGVISEGTARHYRLEVPALEVSIATLRYHRATIEGAPEFISVLRQIVEQQGNPGALQVLAKRATLVLEEYDRIATVKRAG